MKYINPWYTPQSGGAKVYDRTGCPAYKSQCGMGEIVKVFSNHYDYLIDGRVVTQRAGKSFSVLSDCIDAIHNGKKFLYSDRIVEAYNNGG